MEKLIATAASGKELVKNALRETGLDSYWDRVTPLLTEYGFRVVASLVFLILSFYLATLASRGTQQALARAHVETTLSLFLSRVARVFIMLLAVLTCMSIVGIPVTSFAAMLGAGGLAVGLALQGSLSNIAAGAALSITRPFRVGDSVVVAGQRGIVDEIRLFTTILHTVDNRRVIIPNGQIFGTIIENITHHQVRRVQLTINIAYSADIDRTRQVLVEATRTIPGQTQPAAIVVAGLGDWAVNWEINLWGNGEDHPELRETAIASIKRSLEEAAIEIAVPQRIVHLRPQEKAE